MKTEKRKAHLSKFTGGFKSSVCGVLVRKALRTVPFDVHGRISLISVKSWQMDRTTSGMKSKRPVNSRVNRVWRSFGSDDIALRSSKGAQATPTEKMVMPED